MERRAGLRPDSRLSRLSRLVSAASAATWVLAAAVAGAALDMPLHARIPPGGGPVVPLDPAVEVPRAPRSKQPAPPPKIEPKTIEYSPWEEVPT